MEKMIDNITKIKEIKNQSIKILIDLKNLLITKRTKETKGPILIMKKLKSLNIL